MSGPSSVDAPVFLVGSERSGSTLLSHMLDHHPCIAWCGGFEFAVEGVQRQGQWPRVPDYCRALETDIIFQRSGFTVDASLSYPDLMRHFLWQQRNRAGKELVGATVHLRFDRLQWIFPSCRFIHLLRDGRDVSRSRIAMGWDGNMWTAAEHWMIAEQLWDRLRSGLSSGQWHEVRYESLVRTPEAELREICGFIGVPYSPHMLHYPRDTAYPLPDPTLIGQWQRSLSAVEIQLAEARMDDMLRARGYPLSGLPPLRVGRRYAQWLREHDRYRRLRFRIRRYGRSLVAADILARRLHLNPWARHLQRRLNAITWKYFK